MAKTAKIIKLTEVQKAAEWVRFARTNHALYRDTSTEQELIDAINSFAKAQEQEASK